MNYCSWNTPVWIDVVESLFLEYYSVDERRTLIICPGILQYGLMSYFKYCPVLLQ